MSKIDQLLKSLNEFIYKADDEDFSASIPDFPGLDKVPGYIEEYEKKLAKLLRKQKQHFIKGIGSFVSKDVTLASLLIFVTQDLFAEDEFEEETTEETATFLTLTIAEVTAEMMESIDKDVAFNTLSKRTTDWIKEWSADLGKLMKLNSQEALEQALLKGIEEGKSIDDMVQEIRDLPQFDRKRAKRTAQTEVLTACSRSQWEAYKQSPAVNKKKWRHSGGKKNQVRENHEDMDGLVVGVDEEFEIEGSSERCQYPRDPSLSAKERVNCKCVLSPIVDKSILGLSPDEKEKVREEALSNMI